jgi:twin BRCT domain
MLFSGVVACATDVRLPLFFVSCASLIFTSQLVPSDTEVLTAGITALGGQWRAGLTRDVTHLFAVQPGSEKYRTALQHQKETQVKVLVPHWFDDSVRLGIRGLSTPAYEWPEPPILTFGKPSPETSEMGHGLLRPQNKLSKDKKALYKAALITAEQEARLGNAESRDIWGRRRILLSPDLELSDGRRQAIEAGIVRSGGVVVDYNAKRVQAEYNFDILIARYRWGTLYVQVNICFGDLLSKFSPQLTLPSGRKRPKADRVAYMVISCRVYWNHRHTHGTVVSLSNSQETHRRVFCSCACCSPSNQIGMLITLRRRSL